MAALASVSRKRKRDEEKVLLGEPFVIQPHSSSIFESAIKITPAVVFPRKCVPPNWLAGVPPRLFSAYIPALDIPGNILITKTDGERQLSVVEKVSEGVYTLCKLSAHVKMKEVRRIAQLVKKTTSPASEYTDQTKICLEKNWWEGLLLDGFDFGITGEVKRSSVVLSMMHPATAKREILAKQAEKPTEVRLLSPPAESTEFREPTPTEILEQIRLQYLEALYVAKTSIAYFAKSTLSRARVRFQQESTEALNPTPTIDQLVEFLKSMLLPLDKMDIKYKRVIVQVVIDEAINDSNLLKHGEEDYVHRWIQMNFRDKVLQSNDIVLKRQIDDLKTRETELQIILLLEILALTKDIPSYEPAAEDNSKKKKKSKKRSSKKNQVDIAAAPDPNILLDLLLDRLCIWRSIGSDNPSVEAGRPQSPHTKDAGEDRLRHFCVEVVMAFYSSKLPETCAVIQKKFGVNTSTLSGPPGSATKVPKYSKRKVPTLSRSHTAPISGTSSARNSVPPDFVNAPKTTWKNVDLGAVTKKALQKREIQMPTLKGKGTSTVEDELKDAIKCLAKPNRTVVGAEIMDAVAKRLSAGRNRKTKKPTRNSNADNVLVTATPKKKDKLRKIQLTQQLSTHAEEDEDEDMLPPPPPILQGADLQSAVFASPDTRTIKHHFPVSLATDVVPESDPGNIHSTPLKGPSTSRRKQFTSYRYGKKDSFLDDRIPESSSPMRAPISASSLTRSKSCLFPVRQAMPVSLAVAETPQKKARKNSLPFHDDSDLNDDDDDVHHNLMSSGIGGDGHVDQTPVRPRRTSGSTFGVGLYNNTVASRLEFGGSPVVAESTVKGQRRRSTDMVNDSRTAMEEEPYEVSIYEALGWDS